MKRKQDEIEDNKLILQKRRDFLDLVKQGLSTWRSQDDKDQKTSETMTSPSWGRDLGLSEIICLFLWNLNNSWIEGVRQALDNYRRQQTLKSRNDENVDDGEDNGDSTAIKLGRDLGKSKHKDIEFKSCSKCFKE